MTIKEFSDKIGLSTATVSRAFTPGARINPETRERILQEARREGYAPNPNARQLARKSTRLIGLDFPGNEDVLSDPFLVELARGVQAAAHNADFGLVLNTGRRRDDECGLLQEWVFGKAVNGVVIVAPPDFPMERLAPFTSREVPCVLVIQGSCRPEVEMPVVRIDLMQGAREAVMHLIRLGHRRIAHITSSRDDLVERAYEQILVTEGCYHPELIMDAPPTVAGGRFAMHRFLASDQPPTALFGRTDLLTLGALRAVRDMGLNSPGAVSLIGHDDTPLAVLSDPPLTTVRIDTQRLGRSATELILRLMEEDNKESLQPSASDIVIHTELVVRESTMPILSAQTHTYTEPRQHSVIP